MNPKAIRTPAALRDLAELSAYIGTSSHKAEMRFLAAAEAAFQKLSEMPELGGVWESRKPHLDELRFWSIRRFKKYLIFYRPIPEGVEIVRVLYGSRDIESIFDS